MEYFNPWVAILAIQVYVFCAITTLVTITKNLGKTNPFLFFDFRTLVSESVGVLLRTFRNRPTLRQFDGPAALFEVLGVDSRAISPEGFETKSAEFKEMMSRERWTYPASQQSALALLVTFAIQHLRLRDAIAAQAHAAREKAFNRKAQQASNHEVRSVSAGAPHWRKVLGVRTGERDPAVIKKAYGRLVSKAHPDKGGTGAEMPMLNQAIKAARLELKFV